MLRLASKAMYARDKIPHLVNCNVLLVGNYRWWMRRGGKGVEELTQTCLHRGRHNLRLNLIAGGYHLCGAHGKANGRSHVKQIIVIGCVVA